MRTLSSGYELCEAPRPDGVGGVYFSDVAAGGVYRADGGGRVEVVVPRRRAVGGIALHADGGVVVTGRSVCHVRDGVSRDLATVDGVIFNDLCCDHYGRVWVGGSRPVADPASPGRRAGSVFRIGIDGRLDELCGGLGLPNGLGFSPEGDILYVADSASREILALRLDSMGNVVDQRVWLDLKAGQPLDFAFPPTNTTPDGLAVDEDGGVWVAMLRRGLLQRFTTDGTADVAIEAPSALVTSLAFGGDDGKDVFVTTAREPGGSDGALLETRSPIAGLRQPSARV